MDQDATTVGLIFDEKGGKIQVDYVMVGGPVFKSKKLAKDGIIRSIDGKKVTGDGVIKALQGPANTTAILEVECELENRTDGRIGAQAHVDRPHRR